MHIIYPISRHDEKDCLIVAKAITTLGKQHGHRATVLTSPDTGKDAMLFADVIKDTFDKVERVSTQAVPNGGWPRACNQHFMEAALFIMRDNDPEHGQWMWHEMDACPIAPDWCNKLIAEMQLANTQGKNKPFMGVVEDSLSWNEVSKEVQVTGKHMVGVGIYPQNLFANSSLIMSVGQMGVPFDIYMQHEMLPFAHHTDQIAHRWGTEGYEWDGDKMTMRDREPLQFGTRHSNPIDTKNVVLVHGCKDLSLAKVVIDRFEPDIEFAESSEDLMEEEDLAIARPSRRGRKTA